MHIQTQTTWLLLNCSLLMASYNYIQRLAFSVTLSYSFSPNAVVFIPLFRSLPLSLFSLFSIDYQHPIWESNLLLQLPLRRLLNDNISPKTSCSTPQLKSHSLPLMTSKAIHLFSNSIEPYSHPIHFHILHMGQLVSSEV